MSDPTPQVRKGTYARDGFRCASCGSPHLTFQHRRAVGNGGSPIPPSIEDGLTLCALCNNAAEAHIQALALAYGWKVRRWVDDPSRVPVFYQPERQWARLTPDGTRVVISHVLALEMMIEVYGDQYFEWRRS